MLMEHCVQEWSTTRALLPAAAKIPYLDPYGRHVDREEVQVRHLEADAVHLMNPADEREWGRGVWG